jgi:hypothetical protein
MRLQNKAANHLLPKKKKSRKLDDQYWPIIDENYELGLELRRPHEQRWMLSLAFLAGKQYVFFNSAAHILQQIQRVKNRSRIVDNILLPRWRRQVSDLIKTAPAMSVVPNSNEDEDIKAAKLGDKVLQHVWRSRRMKKSIRQLAGWIFSTGNGFLDDRWNPKLGPMQLNEQGEMVYAGDADIGVWSPFEILLPAANLGETDLHSMPWLMKAKWRGLDYLTSNFPRGKEVVEESRPNVVAGANLILGREIRANAKVPGAILKELKIQPCAEFPKGIFVTGANGIILQFTDYPYDYYNLEHFKDIDIPGIFWGKSTVDAALPQQIRWNKTNNEIDEYNRTAKGKLLAPKRSGIEVVQDDTHGEVVYYKPVMGHKPDYINLKSLPPTFMQALDIAAGSTDDLFSQHEITQGTNKSDIRSGEMVARLREQDAHGAIPAHAVFEESLEAVGSRILQRVAKGYTSERMIKVVGRDNEYEVIAFKGADLRNNTDVSVKRQSTLPDSRIDREVEIMNRYQAGLYGDPADPEVRREVLNMLDDVPADPDYGEVKLDEMYASWENNILANQEVDLMLVNEYDNHAVHLKKHNVFRKGLDYQKIKLADPRLFMVLEERFIKHSMMHQEFIDQAMAKMIAQRDAVEGGEANAE